jgi:DNA-binding winged helix-turn-helix (wHTH) protein
VVVQFGPFTFDAARRQLTRGRDSVHLTPKAFDLLELLVGEAPRVVPKAELHKRLWPKSFVADSTLVGLIKELRRALDDRDPHAPAIRTAHRVGYAFCLEVQRSLPQFPDLRHWIVADGRRIALREGENIIGRDPAADVLIDAASVSRRHARILVSHSGALLEDLGSKNGTKVGDLTVGGRVPLQAGDRIHVGSILVFYRSSGSGMSTETQVHQPAPSTRSTPRGRKE